MPIIVQATMQIEKQPNKIVMESSSSQTIQLDFRGALSGHSDQITSLATCKNNTNILISASRDKSILLWQLTREPDQFGIAKRRYKGHSSIVQDVCVTHDGLHALSASWDKSLRLWDLYNADGKFQQERFTGHTQDVMSCCISFDNAVILSGSRDKTIKIWNTDGDCQLTLAGRDGHDDWVTCVRNSPITHAFVSCGYDRVVKVWQVSESQVLVGNLVGHKKAVNSLTVSPDGSLFASGGDDGKILLWDLRNRSHLYSLDAKEPIHSLSFSPINYWLCAALDSSIQIWNLETKSLVATLTTDFDIKGQKSVTPHCTSLAWSADGDSLFAGYTDHKIRVWSISSSTSGTAALKAADE